MKQRSFEARNEARWREFDALVERVEGLGRKRPLRSQRARLAELPGRYREICRDLAIATERSYSPRLLDRLNGLSVAGHRVLYTRDPGFGQRIARFVGLEFPRMLRSEWIFVALATLCFVLPCVIVGTLVHHFPELVYSVLTPDQVRSFEAMYDPAAEKFGTERASGDDVAMFGYYVFNNIGIAFRAFAGGLFLGIGSAIVLVLNGILLGSVAAHIGHVGFEETFYSFVIGHGAFELTAIVIAGAAGLKLGWSVAAPGVLSRLASLRRAAADSIGLVYGVFGMLVVAAVLEAFWSSKASVEPELKFGVGALCWAVVLLYFAFAGRRRGSPRTGSQS